MLVFGERGKLEYPEKNFSEQSREPTQLTYDTESENRIRDTLVEGEHSHHCANLLPRISLPTMNQLFHNTSLDDNFLYIQTKH